MAWISDRIGSWLRVAALCGAAWVGVGQALLAQTVAGVEDAAAMPAPTLEGALHEMSDAAGVVFAGQVVSVRRVEGGAGPSSGVMEVVFRVDKAVRGCLTGESYVLREWAGLWANGEPRYRVGKRLLMMLRTPGAGGLSSPVGGMDGAIPIRGVVSEIAAAGGTSAGAGAATTPVQMVDLRWVGARILRGGGASVASGTTVVSGASVGPKSAGPVGGSATVAGSVATQGASVDTVVGMLNAWGQTNVAR